MYKENNYSMSSNNHSRGIFIGLTVGLLLDALFLFQTWFFFTIVGYTVGEFGILDGKKHH